MKNGAKVHDSLFWQPSEPFDGLLTDATPATYYVRTKNIPATVLPALYGEGGAVLEGSRGGVSGDLYTDAKALFEARRKAEALGGSVELTLRQLSE